MHICMIMSTPFPPEEGIGNYVYGLATHLIRQGHQVTLFTRGKCSRTEKEIIDDIHIIKPPFIPFYPFYIQLHEMFVNQVFRKMSDAFDIIHIHSPLSPLVSTSLPLLATIHTPMLTDTKTRYDETGDIHAKIERVMGRHISYRIEKNLIQRADKITTVARSVSHELKEYGQKEEDIEIIGNGVDERIFFPVNAHESEKEYILYTGRLDYRKGLFDLIESCKPICREHPDISVVITGKGILGEKLKKRVQALGLKKHFHFVGFVTREKLIHLYQHASVYVLPSHYEGLPTVLLEAMSCGCPVVATAVSGNLDVIDHGKNALLIPPKSPKDIADSVLQILANDQLRKNLSQHARKTIEDRFTWEIISKKYIEIYRSLIP